MRFETDVLTLTHEEGCLDCYEGTKHPLTNFACRDEITQLGWILPRKEGSRVVLVFSTTHVEGASTCSGYRLAFAGGCAAVKAGVGTNRKLWWWPMIVTGPK